MSEWSLINVANKGVMELLHESGGFYECPKDEEGKCLGPLVGYAGEYFTVPDDPTSKKLQYLGHVYANFGAAEEHLEVIEYYAGLMITKFSDQFQEIDTICGVPEAGRTLGQELARRLGKRFVYLSKEVVALATATNRKKTKVIMERFDLSQGERLGLIDDVANNFSTTDQSLGIFLSAGLTVSRLFFLYNRSNFVDTVYMSREYGDFPVSHLVRDKQPEYRQDDPAVIQEVQKGNFILKPKIPQNWAQLMEVMAKFKK